MLVYMFNDITATFIVMGGLAFSSYLVWIEYKKSE